MNEIDLHTRLTSQSPPPADAITELRLLILKGLTKSLRGRAGADAAFIEDMTQEAILKIIEKLSTFEGRSQFSSWVLSISIRTAFSALRRKHWGDVSLDELRENGSSPDTVTSGNSSDPSAVATQSDLVTQLHKIIQTKLTSRQRDIILGELNGMPQDEIAHQLGCNRNALYKAGHDARKKLRQELEANGITLADLAATTY